ncbi:MAG: hypothetical protein ACR2PS_14795 [Pseudomonadales bacterium]
MEKLTKYVLVIAAVISLFIAGLFQIEAVQAQDKQADRPLKEIMGDVLDSLAYLMPYSFSSSIWEDLQNDENTQQKIQVLIDSAAAMDQHADLAELEKRYLSRSFSETVALADEAFQSSSGAWAWYSMLDLVEHCAACHTQIPGDGQRAISESLVENIDLEQLERYQSAQIFTAIRQFDKALAAFEAELMDATVSPEQAETSGTYAEYLELIIKTGDDFDRAESTLAAASAREDMPFFLRQRIDVWRANLSTLSKQGPQTPSLDAARKLYDRASELNAIPGMGDGAVMDLAAARMLREFIASSQDLPKNQLAESYFLLALIELRNLQVRVAVPEMELLLQATIQADPNGPLARPAYALLEEFGVNRVTEGANPLTTNPSLIDLPTLRNKIGI